jgi:MFS family permease
VLKKGTYVKRSLLLLFNHHIQRLYVILFCVEFTRGALLISLMPPFVGKELGLATAVVGLSMSVHYAADNAVRSLSGIMVDRFGSRWASLTGFLIMGIGLFFLSKSTAAWQVILLSAIIGIGISPVWTSVLSGITALTTESNRATVMAGMNIAWISGAGGGPILINWFIGRHFHHAFLVLSMFVIAGGIIVFTIKEQWHRVTVRKKQRISGYVQTLRRHLSSVQYLFPGMFLQTFSLGMLMPVISLYAQNELGFTAREYSYILLSGGALALALMVPSGHWVDRLKSPRWFLVCGFAVCGAALFFFPWVNNVPEALLTAGILGISYAIILPAWNATLAKSVTQEQRGVLWGIFMTVEGIGIALGPIAGGFLSDHLSANAPFLTSAFITTALALAYTVIPIRRGENV